MSPVSVISSAHWRFSAFSFKFKNTTAGKNSKFLSFKCVVLNEKPLYEKFPSLRYRTDLYLCYDFSYGFFMLYVVLYLIKCTY